MHPHEEPYIAEAAEDAACVWPGLSEDDDDLIRDVVRQFSEASGGGPSQLLPIHLKEAVSCGSDITELKLVRALRRFVDLCASGSLPTQLSEFMTAANLIPLKKKSGPKDVRPIACGEVLRRVVEQVILRKQLPTVKPHLEPEQVGVGIKDAATQTAIACSQLLPKIAQDPRIGLLQIDLKNAFNSVLRAAVLRQVQQRAPAMFPWAKWSLGGQNLLVCQEETLHGVRGVQQGSPLGPLFFALALQEVLAELRPLFGDASWKIWYLDDGTIFGNLELLEAVLERLEIFLPRIGLELNLRKCVLVTVCAQAEINRFPQLAEVSLVDIRDENASFKMLGVPMGGSVYVKKALEETTAKVEQFCEQLINLDNPQIGFILLRQCCGTCRVVHLMRAMDTNDTARLVEAVDQAVMDSAMAMLRVPCAENARTQLTLPLRLTGCGLARAQTAIACSQVLPKIAQDPRIGLLQTDLKNAFNSVLRAAVLRQVQQRAPAMFPWAKWSLGGQNLLVCQEETLHGVRGVQQGSPLGPLFFALALQEVLAELRPLFGDASWKIWYLDDGTIFGNLELLEAVLERLEIFLPRIGLELNLRKCVLVTVCAQAEINRFPQLAEVSLVDIRDENASFKMLGVPMGGSVYVKKALEETTAKVEQFCEQLINLDNPQIGFILLRQCCGTCRVVHLMRAMDTNDTARLVEAVDQAVMDSAMAMLRVPCAENARTQLTLPLRLTGCGLARATDIAPLAAFTGRWSFYEKGHELVHLPKALFFRTT